MPTYIAIGLAVGIVLSLSLSILVFWKTPEELGEIGIKGGPDTFVEKFVMVAACSGAITMGSALFWPGVLCGLIGWGITIAFKDE